MGEGVGAASVSDFFFNVFFLLDSICLQLLVILDGRFPVKEKELWLSVQEKHRARV